MNSNTKNSNIGQSKHAYITRILFKIPKTVRGHTVATIGEFLGTLSFVFFAFAGTQTANVASNDNTGTTVITTTRQKNPAQLLYISLSFGFSLAVNVWVFFRISGGLFNPAVTFGMWLIGAVTWVRAIFLVIAQMVGAIVGAYLVSALFTGALEVNTTLSATTTLAQGVIIEMLLTAMLVFTIFMLAAEKHAGNFLAPVGIGLALFIAELVGVFWTGGSLNPARSFAPGVVAGFDSSQWVYWVGPLAGSVLAFIIYKIIKSLEYETANEEPSDYAPTGAMPDQKEVTISHADTNGHANTNGHDHTHDHGRHTAGGTAMDGPAAHVASEDRTLNGGDRDLEKGTTRV